MSIRLTSAQKGILCIICSAFFFTVMNLYAKLSGDMMQCEGWKHRMRFYILIRWMGQIHYDKFKSYLNRPFIRLKYR